MNSACGLGRSQNRLEFFPVFPVLRCREQAEVRLAERPRTNCDLHKTGEVRVSFNSAETAGNAFANVPCFALERHERRPPNARIRAGMREDCGLA